MVTDEIGVVPLTMFAKFYDATGPQKVSIVRDVRMMLSDPRGYRRRDYYFDLRNTLRRTHWKTNDIQTFENSLGPLLASVTQISKRDHYAAIGTAYIDFCRRRDVSCFDVIGSSYEIAGLPIRMSVDTGLTVGGQDIVLKLWFNAGKPKRSYRQAVQYLMNHTIFNWPSDWTHALWDVRRKAVLPEVRIPRDFGIAVSGQASAFQQIWRDLADPMIDFVEE